MKDEVLVSVIVPVYNVKGYLRRTVDSLLSQTYRNFELLLIDDGSTDGSAEICDNYEHKDDRIRTIHKQNGGVSSARNCGLQNAKGEYICFVDSDDWVKEGYISDLVMYMKDDIDFVMSDFMYTNGAYEYVPNVKEAIVGDIEVLFPDRNSLKNCYAPYGKLFKRKLIVDKEICYNTFIHNGEDRFFVFTYLSYVNKVAFSPMVNYCYCRRAGSLISKFYSFEQEYYAYEKSLELVEMVIKRRGDFNSTIVANLYTMICDFANRAINSVYHTPGLPYVERMKLIKQIDLQFLGKYMYVGNMKEGVIKFLFALRQYWLYDVVRMHLK